MNTKKILLVGSGGREHALALKLLESPLPIELYVAPGNAGTSRIAVNVPIKATDIDGLLTFVLGMGIEFTIVGQDDPLALRIVDLFQEKGLKIFGPTRAAAQIETSKVFAKGLMNECGVRTSPFCLYTEYGLARVHIRQHFTLRPNVPIVIKASGLALGKGVSVCRTLVEAELALDEIMVKRIHGSAGDVVVIEEYLKGQELSIHAFCDGITSVLFPAAQDHKPVFDGDKGPNTGGMGTIAPLPWFHSYGDVKREIVDPILRGLHNKGTPFTGLLFPGLMAHSWDQSTSPQYELAVLEYNARFGDPETQSLLRLLKTDLLEILEACVDGRLHEIDVRWHGGFVACVVMASEGYPSPNYKKGVPITGIEDAESLSGVVVFQAGTKIVDGQLVTSGGRVLGVSARGETLRQAIDRAYEGVRLIRFEGAHYRTDIGARSLQ